MRLESAPPLGAHHPRLFSVLTQKNTQAPKKKVAKRPALLKPKKKLGRPPKKAAPKAAAGVKRKAGGKPGPKPKKAKK